MDENLAHIPVDEAKPMTLPSEGGAAPRLVIPAIEDMAEFIPDPKLLSEHAIVGFDSRDARSRPFKLLRTQFSKILSQRKARLVGITSAAPNAGKSFMSLNLAATLSRVAGSTVYLVDLDLRRASIAAGLGLEAELGIADFLEGDTDDLGALGWRISMCNLGIFPTNKATSSSAELIASDRYRQLVETFQKERDNAIILFDLPPVFANDDTMLAMEGLDGYIMVVDAGVTTSRQVRDTIQMLSPAVCLGAVLNRYSGGFADHYGYGYGYGYREYAKYNE